MKKKSVKRRIAKKSTKTKTKRSIKRKVNKTRSKIEKRKNPKKTLTEEKLLELASRKDVDSVRVLDFFNSSFVKTNYRETVLEWLKEYTNSYNLNLPTVKAIREGIDLLHNYSGPSERSFDFSHYGDLVESDRYEGYLTELTGAGNTYPKLSRKRGNWY